MPIKEADKVRNQILALLDVSNVEQYIAGRQDLAVDPRTRLMDVGNNAIRFYADHLRKLIGQGATDSSFSVC